MSGEDKAAKSCRHADTMDPTEDAFRQDSEEPGEFDAMIKQYKDMASGHQARRGSLRVEGNHAQGDDKQNEERVRSTSCPTGAPA